MSQFEKTVRNIITHRECSLHAMYGLYTLDKEYDCYVGTESAQKIITHRECSLHAMYGLYTLGKEYDFYMGTESAQK